MADPVNETRILAEAYGVQFSDCGNGHVQISGHGVLVNYYPTSKKRTLFSPTLNRRETNCTPWDAVRLCLSEAKPGMKPKKPAKNKAAFSIEPVATNLAGVQNFYNGEVVPWDESLGSFKCETSSDELRIEAYELEQKAIAMRARADLLDSGDLEVICG